MRISHPRANLMIVTPTVYHTHVVIWSRGRQRGERRPDTGAPIGAAGLPAALRVGDHMEVRLLREMPRQKHLPDRQHFGEAVHHSR